MAFTWTRGGAALFAVVDALGHGPDAAVSAKIAAGVLARCADRPLREIFEACDQGLREHRAAVLSAIQVREDRVWFAGIGNVEIYGPPGLRRPPTTAGVVGRGLRKLREWPLHVEDGERWVLVSDGIRRRSVAAALNEARPLPPDEAASKILQLAGREDDDVAVVVVDWDRR